MKEDRKNWKGTLKKGSIDGFQKEIELAEISLGAKVSADYVGVRIGNHLLKIHDKIEVLEIDNKSTSEYSKEELSKIAKDISTENPKLRHTLRIKF